MLAGASSTEMSLDVPPAQGRVQEIEVGDGPEWGTLSGLTAHPTNPQRLFAVTDQDPKPTRIIEIELARSRPKPSVRSR